MAHPVFKDYRPNQPMFLPENLEDFIGEDHQARFISYLIDRMNISEIIDTYKGGGTSSYHPRMLLKVLIYAYVQRVHSSRQIAKATRENVVYMWLAGRQRPDFRTINNFRKDRLPEGGVKAIFRQIMWTLVEQGLVDLADYTVDGTTLEANARPRSAVWAKNSERYRRKAIERIDVYFEELQRLADLEDQQFGEEDLAETGQQSDWSSDDVEEAAERASEALDAQAEKSDVEAKKLSKAATRLRWITDKELPKLKKYEHQQQILGERNSYSKTDPDAAFMRLKSQSPFDKLLSPAYNLQMGTQNPFILGYSLHSNAADKVNLEAHLDGLEFTPDRLCADAGYGTLANFQMLAERGIRGVVKYPGYDRSPKTYNRYNFQRSPATDSYRCPQRRTMKFKQTQPYEYGDDQTTPMRTYECIDCSGCPVKAECTKGEGNRTISFITKLEGYKRQMRARLSDGKGHDLMESRGAEIEAVFGQLTRNDGLARLSMRGRKMVELEVGLISIAHNLRKMHKCLKDGLESLLEKIISNNTRAMAA